MLKKLLGTGVEAKVDVKNDAVDGRGRMTPWLLAMPALEGCCMVQLCVCGGELNDEVDIRNK
jgi:hypothetical protein